MCKVSGKAGAKKEPTPFCPLWKIKRYKEKIKEKKRKESKNLPWEKLLNTAKLLYNLKKYVQGRI